MASAASAPLHDWAKTRKKALRTLSSINDLDDVASSTTGNINYNISVSTAPANPLLHHHHLSATSRVLHTPELLEQILSFLPPNDLILRLPLVSPHIHALLLTSPSLRRKTFRSPDPTLLYAPFPILPRPGKNLHITQFTPHDSSITLWFSPAFANHTFALRRGLSPFLLRQPPIRAGRMEIRVTTYGAERGGHGAVERVEVVFGGGKGGSLAGGRGGLTFGDVFHEVGRVGEWLGRRGREVKKGGLVTVTVRPRREDGVKFGKGWTGREGDGGGRRRSL